jgi:hypothetical protein
MWVELVGPESVAVVGGAVVVLSGVGYLFRKIRALFRFIERIHEVTTKELEPNHGGSMKDDMHGLAVSLGKLQRRVDTIESRYNLDHPRKRDRHHT